MIDVSQEFQEALENGNRDYLVKVDINPPNLIVVKPFTSKTIKGITITYNADGSVILNGTADENGCIINVMAKEITLAADRYRIFGYPDGCSAETYTMKLYTKLGDNYWLYTCYNNGTIINTTQHENETIIAAQIEVQAGVTVSNLMFKPTLRKLSNILSFTKDDLIELPIEDAVSQDSKFTALGGTVINKAIVTLDNSSENYSTYDFKGAEVAIKIGLQIGDSPEYIDRGVYIVDSAIPQGIGLELSCLDYMSKFDKSYTESNLTYPATIQEVIQDACTICGVAFTGTYPDSDYVLTIKPTVSTFREVLSAIGQITGTYAHVDRQGQLYFSWFNTTLLNQAIDSDTKITGVHYIEDVIDNTYEKDNITIDGIRAYIINEESNEKFEYHYPSTLADDSFCLNLTGNPLIHGGNITEIINRVGPRIVGLTIRQTNCKHINNPLIEAGDVAMVLYSVKNNTNAYYPIVITRTTFIINKAQETVCGVETLSENLDGRYSDTQLLREQTKKDTNDARKVATNYLSADTTGIMIADLADGAQTPSTATGRNVKIDNNAIYIRDGQTTIAQFGDVVTIGKTDGSESYQQLDYHSLQMVDVGGNTYLHVSDLRGREGVYEVTESYVITIASTSTTFVSVGMYINELVSVLVDDIEYIQHTVVSSGHYGITISQGFSEGAQITIIYRTTSIYAKAYTFGFRSSGSAIGGLSFVEGNNNAASGFASHVEGSGCSARGSYSHAEGNTTRARGDCSHAEGYQTTASGSETHAEGYHTTASGLYSHAEGSYTTASGSYSHAGGLGTIAEGTYQTVIGAYNKTQSYTPFIIGNGADDDNRHNVFTVNNYGQVHIISATTAGGSLYLKDKDENTLGYINPYFESATNSIRFDIYAGRMIDNSLRSSGLIFRVNNDGEASVGFLGTGFKDSFRTELDVYSKSESESRYVNVSGDTMTGDLTINKNMPTIYFRGTGSTRIDAPSISSNLYVGRIHFRDSNGDTVNYIESARASSDNHTWTSFIHRRTKADGSAYINHGFYLQIANDETVSVTFPSTASRDAWATGMNVVKKAGDTMTGALTLKSSDIKHGTIPSSIVYGNSRIYFTGSNDGAFGQIRAYSDSVGVDGLNLIAYRPISGENVYNSLTIGVDSNGDRKVTVSEIAPWLSALGLTPTAWGTNKVVKYKKQGNIVTTTWSGTNTDVAIPENTWTTVATLPSGYRPSENIYGVGWLASNHTCAVRIQANGKVDVVTKSGTGTINSGMSLRFSIAFVI